MFEECSGKHDITLEQLYTYVDMLMKGHCEMVDAIKKTFDERKLCEHSFIDVIMSFYISIGKNFISIARPKFGNSSQKVVDMINENLRRVVEYELTREMNQQNKAFH